MIPLAGEGFCPSCETKRRRTRIKSPSPRPRHRSPHSRHTTTQGKLFLGGLDDNITKEDLDAYGSQW